MKSMSNVKHASPPDNRLRRVISLDFDGVLHPARDPDVPVFAWLEHLVTLLASHPDVMLLVHSSWREAYRSDEIGEMLQPLDDRFIGVVPHGERYAALCAWLKGQQPELALLIVDDDRKAYPPSVSDDSSMQIVYCDPTRGLSCPHVQASIAAWLEESRRMPVAAT
jgi:hypothetical protein